MAIGKTYTIALDDKAAFLNRLKKQNIQLDTNGIQDNTLNHTFTVTIHDPTKYQVVDQILAQSKDINDNPSTKLPSIKDHPKLQELKKLIQKELKEIKIIPNNTLSNIMNNPKFRQGLILSLPYISNNLKQKFTLKEPGIKQGTYFFDIKDREEIGEQDQYRLVISPDTFDYFAKKDNIGIIPYDKEEDEFYWVPGKFKGIKFYWSFI